MRRRPSVATMDAVIRWLRWDASDYCCMPDQKKHLEIALDWLKREREMQRIRNAAKRKRRSAR